MGAKLHHRAPIFRCVLTGGEPSGSRRGMKNPSRGRRANQSIRHRSARSGRRRPRWYCIVLKALGCGRPDRPDIERIESEPESDRHDRSNRRGYPYSVKAHGSCFARRSAGRCELGALDDGTYRNHLIRSDRGENGKIACHRPISHQSRRDMRANFIMTTIMIIVKLAMMSRKWFHKKASHPVRQLTPSRASVHETFLMIQAHHRRLWRRLAVAERQK
jgi:hypothetical protein